MKSKLCKSETGPTHLWIWCPGCDEPHCPVVEGAPGYEGPVWDWNGDLEKPTVAPSILCDFERGENYQRHVCHSFVRDGHIQFLSDCTHELAGQTVSLPQIEGPDDFDTAFDDDPDGDW